MADDSAHRDAVVEALEHVLGNTCRLFRTALCCKWNVTGPYGTVAADIFERHAIEMFSSQNALAARIRALGGIAVPDDSDRVIVKRPAEIDYRHMPATAMADLLKHGHTGAVLSIDAASDVAHEVGDEATIAVLQARHLAHTSQMYDLDAFICARR